MIFLLGRLAIPKLPSPEKRQGIVIFAVVDGFVHEVNKEASLSAHYHFFFVIFGIPLSTS
jgi:hypothetical protein